MPETILSPVITSVGEGKVWNVVGDTITRKVAGHQTGGAYAVIEEVSPPQCGPPLHLHRATDEIFYVVEGEYEVVCGDLTFNASPGTLFVAPKGVSHSLRNISSAAGRVLITLVPGGFEKFFEEVNGVTDPDVLVEIAKRHDVEFLPPHD